MDEQKLQGAVMTDERRGRGNEGKSLDERVANLEHEVDRLLLVLDLLSIVKVGLGPVWRWFEKHIRGQG